MFGELRSIIVVRLFLLKKELPQPYFPWPHFPQDFEEEKTVIIWFHVQAKILPSHSFYSIRGKLQTHTHTNITHTNITHTHTHTHPHAHHTHNRTFMLFRPWRVFTQIPEKFGWLVTAI